MSPVRMGLIGSVSLVSAIGLALFARGLASSHERKAPVAVAAPAPAPTARVLVARRDLQPGDRLTSGDFSWQSWPIEGLNPAYITDGAAPTAGPAGKGTVKIANAAVDAVGQKARDVMSGGVEGGATRMVDAVVREPILAGEPITERKVVRTGAGGVLAVALDPGMRAMAVPLSAESAAGGFILPGDHVDVVQSRQVDAASGAKKYAAGAVLRNVKVLAIDQSTKPEKSASVIGATATLEVTPDQAELLALSKSQGELTLILRSYADDAGPASAGQGPKAAVAEAGPPPDVVRVFRNGAPSDVQVAR